MPSFFLSTPIPIPIQILPPLPPVFISPLLCNSSPLLKARTLRDSFSLREGSAQFQVAEAAAKNARLGKGRYRGAAPTIGGGGGGGGEGRGRARFVFAGPGDAGGQGRGLDEAAIAALPRKEVAEGDPAADCAVCITELAAGEAARLLPRCGHVFHVECVDMWLRSHSTCPLCRCAVADEAPAMNATV
ncbi:hypothetical protein ABZP36_017877 [Zizania latifolia]